MAEIGVRAAVFQQVYDGRPPWDTGRPQPALVALADQLHRVVLDVGWTVREITHAEFEVTDPNRRPQASRAVIERSP